MKSGDGVRLRREVQQTHSTEDCDETFTETHPNGAKALGLGEIS